MAFELSITGGLLSGCFNGLLKEIARGKPSDYHSKDVPFKR
jgi:hypothetical protein